MTTVMTVLCNQRRKPRMMKLWVRPIFDKEEGILSLSSKMLRRIMMQVGNRMLESAKELIEKHEEDFELSVMVQGYLISLHVYYTTGVSTGTCV
jgi:hypothetical protein